MDFLNNANTIVGIIGGIMTIVAFITYVRNKASSAQKKQTIQLQSIHSQSSYQAVSKSLSKLDWVEVLWAGLEDCAEAREGAGCANAVMCGVVEIFITGIVGIAVPKVAGICFLVGGILYALSLLCFYAYFVGRRAEQKIEEINQ